MYSSCEPPFNSDTAYPPEPLLPGHYYLVDISDAITAFYSTPSRVRMHLVADTDELTEYDMVDVELTEIIPCISALSECDYELNKHVECLLDEGVEHTVAELEDCGIETEGRMIPNTAEQLGHASAVYDFGHHLKQLFVQHGLYNEQGELIAEYSNLLAEGVIALRQR